MSEPPRALTPLPYQERWLADNSRFKIGIWARQTGKTFACALEAVDDCIRAELRGKKSSLDRPRHFGGSGEGIDRNSRGSDGPRLLRGLRYAQRTGGGGRGQGGRIREA